MKYKSKTFLFIFAIFVLIIVVFCFAFFLNKSRTLDGPPAGTDFTGVNIEKEFSE